MATIRLPDSQPCSPPACTAQSSAIGNAERLRPSAPRLLFSPATGLTPRGTPQACFPSGPATRNGLSLTCNDCASQRLHSRVKAPGLLLRHLTCLLHCPFGLLLCYRSRFAPFAAASTLQARCSFACKPGLPLSLSPLPIGVFTPAGSKRSTGFAACLPTFRTRPISYRSPQSFSITSVSTADHRSWSATFPEACCSSNL